MLYLPKGDTMFDMLPVSSVSISELLDDDQTSRKLIEVHTKLSSNAFISEGNVLICGFEFHENIVHLGSLSIDKMMEYIRENPCRLHMSKIDDELFTFFLDLADSVPKFRNLDTRYFSLWRFADVIAEEGLSGYVSVQYPDGTLWSIYKDGINSGGYLVLAEKAKTTRLSDREVLQHSVKLVGRIDFHQIGGNAEIVEVNENTVLKRSDSFLELLDTDSQTQRRIIRQFGEMGVELAMHFNGKKSIKQISEESREPIERVINLASALIQLEILVRSISYE